MYIRDSAGNKSMTATMAVVAFAIVMFKVLLNGVSLSLGSVSYTFGTIDSLMIAAIFGPILGSYTARRWNDPPMQSNDDETGSKPGDGRE